MRKKSDNVLALFPSDMREQWKEVAKIQERIYEIRLRANQVICVYVNRRECYLSQDGEVHSSCYKGISISREEVERIVHHICKYSIYAYEQELKQGYITVEGGHRIGMVGQAIVEGGKIKNMKNISGLNIRIAHEIIGAADHVLPYLYENGELYNTFIISPPMAGKTTILRDLIRQVSDGNAYGEGVNVSVVDERSEIGGSYLGVPQNRIGMRTDLLDACPKGEGMMQLIRAMSPKMLAVDELGSASDVLALEEVLQCGCKIMATIHGKDILEFQKKKNFQSIIEQRSIERYIVLGATRKVGEILGIYNKEFQHV